MHIPFVSSLLKSRAEPEHRHLYKRKGGGGKGGGGSSGGKSSSSSSSTISGGGSRTASTYSSGGGSATTIGSGSAFAGRTQGGGERSQVYGNQQYGSGYPGAAGAGVAGRGFPFVYWPLAWGGAAGVGGSSYYYNREYGRSDNSSRPGGPMVAAAFVSNSTSTIYRLVADNQTVTALLVEINANCSSSMDLSASSKTPSVYDNNPLPSAAIQYYRASSVSLTLDGYNNTAVFQDDPNNATVTPLPTNIDTALLTCLNTTIGEAVPLIDNSGIGRFDSNKLGVVGLLWVAWHLLGLVV